MSLWPRESRNLRPSEPVSPVTADWRIFKPISACCSLILCNCTRASSLKAASWAVRACSRVGLVRPRLLLERNQHPILLAPRASPVLLHEGKPEARLWRQREIEQPFVPRKHLQTGLRQHVAVVGNDRVERDAVHP